MDFDIDKNKCKQIIANAERAAAQIQRATDKADEARGNAGDALANSPQSNGAAKAYLDNYLNAQIDYVRKRIGLTVTSTATALAAYGAGDREMMGAALSGLGSTPIMDIPGITGPLGE
ncbi:Uncharacterised protein [Mycobacteroides abscessus subsp. abscessus]|nr:Uncharacterised protein [Mycobacteroides abscessus subsp. abscessus]